MSAQRKLASTQPPADMLARIRRMYPKSTPLPKRASEMTIDEVIAEGQRGNAQTEQWIRDNHPLARKGLAFKPGKPKGSLAPLNKAIRAYVRKHPTETARQVWIGMSERPPRGYVFIDNPRFGKYVEGGDGQTIMEWKTFRNVVSEHRPRPHKRGNVPE